MSDLSASTLVGVYLDELRAGDQTARERLLGVASGRLEALARKMLRGQFGRVGRWLDTGDVYQTAALRLWKSLATAAPESPLHFHRLAARLIRNELVDLARHYYGPLGQGGNHESVGSVGLDGVARAVAAPAAGELHSLVQDLPPEEAEVTDLLFYQGLGQEETAGLLGVDVRTVQRRWQRARRKLGSLLAPDDPPT